MLSPSASKFEIALSRIIQVGIEFLRVPDTIKSRIMPVTIKSQENRSYDARWCEFD